MNKSKIYVRIEMNVAGAPATVHVAEISPFDDSGICLMERILELSDGAAVTGIAHGQRHEGMSVLPKEVVPHPDTYSEMPDIISSRLTEEEFEGLWEEALQKFPDF